MTNKQFVKKYYPEAEFQCWIKPWTHRAYTAIVEKFNGKIIAIGIDAQDAWMEAARKIKSERKEGIR